MLLSYRIQNTDARLHNTDARLPGYSCYVTVAMYKMLYEDYIDLLVQTKNTYAYNMVGIYDICVYQVQS